MLITDEQEIVRLIIKNYNNKEISKALEISEYKVRTMIKTILNKTGARNKTNLAYLAGLLGLIDED